MPFQVGLLFLVLFCFLFPEIVKMILKFTEMQGTQNSEKKSWKRTTKLRDSQFPMSEFTIKL